MHIAEIRESLRLELPTLRVTHRDGATFVSGRLPVLAFDGTEIDAYQIEIELSKSHPKAPPEVREVGGRIPHTVDRHNPNGTACLFVPDQQWEYWDESKSITDFIKNGPVRDFFFSQTYFEQTGKWPFGDRPHGVAGVIDYYFELLETKSLETVFAFVNLLAADSVRAGTMCYCGGVTWLSDCHIDRLLQIRGKIPRRRARNTLKRLLASPLMAALAESDVPLNRTALSIPVGLFTVSMNVTKPQPQSFRRRKQYRA